MKIKDKDWRIVDNAKLVSVKSSNSKVIKAVVDGKDLYGYYLKPLKVGKTEIKNRIFMPPISTNLADKGYVTKDGIFRKSQVAFEITDFQTVTLDGDLSDWEGINGVNLTGTGDYSYKDVTWYARLTDEGMFVAAKAHHDVYINNDPTWHCNTNLEFWVSGNNQKYIAANGNCAGGVYGTYTSVAYEGEAEYETVFEDTVTYKAK